VPVTKKPDEHSIQQLSLAHDNFFDFGGNLPHNHVFVFNLPGDFLDIHIF
jgi:hypothetical protein